MKKQICHGLLFGLILYLVSVSRANLSYLVLPQGLSDLLYSVAYGFTGLFAFIVLIYRSCGPLNMCFRAFLLQLGFWGCFLLDSLIGISRLLIPMDVEHYGWGLILLSFWAVFSAVSVTTLLGAGITHIIKLLHSE